MPAFFLALLVLQSEGDNSLSLADGILALGLVTLEGRVDHVERGGGLETVFMRKVELAGGCKGVGPRSTHQL